MEYRMEHDSMGEVRVPADKYWGAQTERSHNNFPIGVGIETMPAEIIHAFGILKKAAARANRLTGGRDTPPSVRHALHQPPLLIRDPYTHRLHLLLFRVCAEEGRVKQQGLRAGRRRTIKFFSRAGNIWPAFPVFMM